MPGNWVDRVRRHCRTLEHLSLLTPAPVPYRAIGTDDAEFVISLAVDDIREAMSEMQAAGLELVGDPVWAAEAFGDATLGEFAWFFDRAPDGRVFAIEQVPDLCFLPNRGNIGSRLFVPAPLHLRTSVWIIHHQRTTADLGAGTEAHLSACRDDRGRPAS